ncbi:hypothetical protein I546_3585 [Mycobacterium kansasii 732]|nr:hypothetical protein I546_3585 [Mycobacterium kansasii 732]
MSDNQFSPQFSPLARLASSRSPLELLDTVPDSLLRRLKQYSGRLATEAVSAMQERLPFFADLEASQRASVALVVQTAVVNFVEWMQDPHSDVSYTAQAFELVPQDLTRRIALRHTVDMVRVTMEFFEEVVPLLARSEEQLTALTVGILKYSRDLAFTAASAYADAAEARGTWDSRMEASVVDAVVRGDTGPELLSRAAALNWDTTAPATVVVGARRRGATARITRTAASAPARTSATSPPATAAQRSPTCTAPGWWPLCPATCRPPINSSRTCWRRSPTGRWSSGRPLPCSPRPITVRARRFRE